MNRRLFLKTSTAACCLSAFRTTYGRATIQKESNAYQLVASTDRQRILTAAKRYVSHQPVTITAYPAKRSAGGLHDFYSQADYFWPDPKNPNGPYINRDGQSNPNNFAEHRRVMVALSIEMPTLTAAWLLTGNRHYGLRACDHLRAWFVAPATRMNPNLMYAQAVQGRSTGRSYGIIDTIHLVEVARAAGFLMGELLNQQESQAVRSWFAGYLDWLCQSERGQEERDTKNNHAICWTLQAAEFARLTKNEPIREDVYRRYRQILLPNQEAEDGSFPRELARTKPYCYSIFNFDVMTGLCQSLKGLVPDPPTFRLTDGRGLLKAAEFVYPYIADKSKWRWTRDVEHFDALPVRAPGLLFAGIAGQVDKYIELWKTLNPDPTDKEIIRNFPIRQPLLWV